MLSEEILYLPIRALARHLRRRDFSPVELTTSYLHRAERLGPRFNAFATLTPDLAMAQARAAEREIMAGHYRGPLHGIPFAVKDLLAVQGYPTTWGARPFARQAFDFDATVVRRLNDAGAVLIGKAAMIELAGGLGYSGPYASLTGPCRNPWDPRRWTCGSSSGPGAIMAAGLAAFAIGSDTRGSIICPSTLCGISGMRPSFGRVSRYGAMTIAWSMDKLGPMTRDADSCGLVLAAIAGHDARDHDSLPEHQSRFHYSAPPRLRRPPRIGRLSNAFPNARPYIWAAADRALEVMRSHGAVVEEVAIPEGNYEDAAELVILIEAASAFHHLISSGRCALLEDPLGQINGYASLEFSADDYLHIQRARLFLQRRMYPLFSRFDVLAAPGEGSIAPLIGQPPGAPHPAPHHRTPASPPAHPPQPRPHRRYIPSQAQPDAISSLCGLPVVTVPCGFSPEGLPLGIQFMGPALGDGKAIAAAHQFQSFTDWQRRHPKLA
ncbi:MAG: amidase [Terriglobales bacterium]